MAPTVVLFDIDGTLIHAGGAGRRAIDRTFQDLFGNPASFSFPLDGLSDPVILRRSLCESGGSEALFAERREEIFRRYLHFLALEMRHCPGYEVKPGIPALVRSLAGIRDATLGLLTGNLEEGARIKLAPSGLNPFFPFGGFGSDAQERSDICRAALERLPAWLQGSPCRLVIVGDTPHDIRAAREAGAVSIGVATGRTYSLEDLKRAGATYLFPDLSDTASVLLSIGAGSGL